jgi:hypothetical protein
MVLRTKSERKRASYEFSELTAPSHGTLVLFSNGERFARLNMQ